MIDTVQRAKQALWDSYHDLNPDIPVDAKGYLGASDKNRNLLQFEWMELIRGDYEKGGGKELEWKFRAVHSSATLVANHFARFKREPHHLTIIAQSGLDCPSFEKPLPTGLRGIPPNLDLFVENRDCCIAIESKLLETLSLKKPHFSPSYRKDRLPYCEPQWWKFIESAPNAVEGYLDTAQLVKHYLGLIYHLKKNKIDKKPILLYLYWNPTNALEIEEYQKHDQEVKEFKDMVTGSSVEFISMSYPELWEVWSKEPSLADHAKKLMERYFVRI
jgi:hypothetical protein